MSDTSTEAGERLARHLDTLVHKSVGPDAPTFVRAICAERDALKVEVERLREARESLLAAFLSTG